VVIVCEEPRTNVVISIWEYELAQWDMFFGVLTYSGSSLTPPAERIPGAFDFLFDVLRCYQKDQIRDGRCTEDTLGDSPIQVSCTPGMAKKRMLGSWRSCSMNDMDSHSPQGIRRIPIGMSH